MHSCLMKKFPKNTVNNNKNSIYFFKKFFKYIYLRFNIEKLIS